MNQKRYHIMYRMWFEEYFVAWWPNLLSVHETFCSGRLHNVRITSALGTDIIAGSTCGILCLSEWYLAVWWHVVVEVHRGMFGWDKARAEAGKPCSQG